jgi:hypothetical protein
MTKNDRFDFLGRSVSARMEQKLREGRRRALGAVASCRVTLTLDDGVTREELFQSTPTFREVVERIGMDTTVVSLAVARQKMASKARMVVPAR